MPLFIVKEGTTEKFSDDRAVGTLVKSGVTSSVALETVSIARSLFKELKVNYVPVNSWVIISEEIRRGNLATATLLIKELPKEQPHVELKSSSESILNLSDEELISLTKEILNRPERFDSYAHIQANEDFFISSISVGDPLLGYITARFSELMDYSILKAGREVAEDVFKATNIAISELQIEIPNGSFSRWKKRYFAMTNTIAKDNFYIKKKELLSFIHLAIKSGRLVSNSFLNAIKNFDINVNNNIPPVSPKIKSPDHLKFYRLSEKDKTTTRTRPVIKHPDPTGLTSRPKDKDDGDDPRDTPPPNYFGEELNNLYFERWTTEDWPPFIKPDRHVLFCKKPIRNNEGDRTKVIEFSGGYSLQRARPKAKQLQFISNTWDPRVNQYWPPFPSKATLIPTGESTWVDSFIIKTSDTDDPNPLWTKIEEKIREELNKESTKDKIKEKINDTLDDVLGDVTLFGIGLGGAASGAAKLATSAIIEFINWLLDEVFSEESFQTIVVTHKTKGGPAGVESWLTWGTIETNTAKAISFDPRMDDPNIDTYDGKWRLSELKAYQKQHQTKGMDMPGIYWKGESMVPDRLPGDINSDFTLRNAWAGEIYWPPHFKWGGHVFLPVKARESDAVYCIAIRTEVRAVWLQTW